MAGLQSDPFLTLDFKKIIKSKLENKPSDIVWSSEYIVQLNKQKDGLLGISLFLYKDNETAEESFTIVTKIRDNILPCQKPPLLDETYRIIKLNNQCLRRCSKINEVIQLLHKAAANSDKVTFFVCRPLSLNSQQIIVNGKMPRRLEPSEHQPLLETKKSVSSESIASQTTEETGLVIQLPKVSKNLCVLDSDDEPSNPKITNLQKTALETPWEIKWHESTEKVEIHKESPNAKLGMKYKVRQTPPESKEMQKYFIIESVTHRSLAERHGLNVGDMVLSINQKPLLDDNDLLRIEVSQQQVITLILQRPQSVLESCASLQSVPAYTVHPEDCHIPSQFLAPYRHSNNSPTDNCSNSGTQRVSTGDVSLAVFSNTSDLRRVATPTISVGETSFVDKPTELLLHDAACPNNQPQGWLNRISDSSGVYSCGSCDHLNGDAGDMKNAPLTMPSEGNIGIMVESKLNLVYQVLSVREMLHYNPYKTVICIGSGLGYEDGLAKLVKDALPSNWTKEGVPLLCNIMVHEHEMHPVQLPAEHLLLAMHIASALRNVKEVLDILPQASTFMRSSNKTFLGVPYKVIGEYLVNPPEPGQRALQVSVYDASYEDMVMRWPVGLMHPGAIVLLQVDCEQDIQFTLDYLHLVLTDIYHITQNIHTFLVVSACTMPSLDIQRKLSEIESKLNNFQRRIYDKQIVTNEKTKRPFFQVGKDTKELSSALKGLILHTATAVPEMYPVVSLAVLNEIRQEELQVALKSSIQKKFKDVVDAVFDNALTALHRMGQIYYYSVCESQPRHSKKTSLNPLILTQRNTFRTACLALHTEVCRAVLYSSPHDGIAPIPRKRVQNILKQKFNDAEVILGFLECIRIVIPLKDPEKVTLCSSGIDMVHAFNVRSGMTYDLPYFEDDIERWAPLEIIMAFFTYWELEQIVSQTQAIFASPVCLLLKVDLQNRKLFLIPKCEQKDWFLRIDKDVRKVLTQVGQQGRL